MGGGEGMSASENLKGRAIMFLDVVLGGSRPATHVSAPDMNEVTRFDVLRCSVQLSQAHKNYKVCRKDSTAGSTRNLRFLRLYCSTHVDEKKPHRFSGNS